MKKSLILGITAVSLFSLAACTDLQTSEESKIEVSKQKQIEESNQKAEASKQELLAKQEAEAKASKEAQDSKNEAEARATQKAQEEKAAKEAEDKNPDTYPVIAYEEMARNGNNHKLEKLQITGKVIQVSDYDTGGAMLRVATNGSYDDVYIVQVPKEAWESHRLLDDDVITFYGKVYGLYSYQSTMGCKITVPALIATFY